MTGYLVTGKISNTWIDQSDPSIENKKIKLAREGQGAMSTSKFIKFRSISRALPYLVAIAFLVSGNVQAQFGSTTVFEDAPGASWIAPPDLPGTEFAVFHVRKTFTLDSVPEEFVVHLSADNRYRLSVNGQPVAAGPQRSDLMHWRYETLDLAPFLQSGTNLITAVVWNWGQYKPAAQFTNRSGFLLQGNSAYEAALVNSDESWKVLHNQAYEPIPVVRGTVNGYYAAQPGEAVHGSQYPWGWETVGYNDDAWPDAQRAGGIRLRGTAGTGGGNGWQLVPSTLPQMEESLTRFDEVRRSEGIDANDAFLSGEGDLVIPAGSTVSILVDQAHLTNAYVALNLSGGAGSSIELTYAEALLDADGQKGNRNDIEGKTIKGIHDAIYPDGGANRDYQTLWFRTYRYVQLDIETADQPLQIHDLHGIYTAYPFELKASFTSDQNWLEDMWEINWRVARLCAWETYFDTPYYEQLQYLGDTRIQALLTMYMSDDDRLVRQAISHFDMSRIPEGITASRYPSELGQYIPTFSLIWVAMVHDYWMYRDDQAYVESMLPGIRSVISWFEQRVDETGIVGPISWWPFIDWADGWQTGRPPGAIDGHSVMISLQFAYALQRAAELEDHLGEEGMGDHYRSLADSIISTAQSVAWDDNERLFKDSLESTTFSQQTNTMAVLVGAVPESEQGPFVESLINNTEITQSTYYYSFYVLEALRQAGLADQYIDQLTPWQTMLDLGLTTTPETPEPTRSDSHAWSAHPNYGLLATVLGIRPAEPGFRSVRIEPALGDLEFAEGAMPHELGMIEVELEPRGSDGVRATIVLPEGLSGTFVWNGRERVLSGGEQEFTL